MPYIECSSKSIDNFCSLTLLTFFESLRRTAELTSPVTTTTQVQLIILIYTTKSKYKEVTNYNITVLSINRIESYVNGFLLLANIFPLELFDLQKLPIVIYRTLLHIYLHLHLCCCPRIHFCILKLNIFSHHTFI